MSQRFVIHNIRWRRIGERSGILRRRRWQQRIWVIGEADTEVVAAQILAKAYLRWDEAVFLYDHEKGGARVGARYGEEWQR